MQLLGPCFVLVTLAIVLVESVPKYATYRIYGVSGKEYEQAMRIVQGLDPIDESRSVPSASDIVKIIGAGITTGITVGLVPAVLTYFGLTQANASVVANTNKTPLCVISDKDIAGETHGRPTKSPQYHYQYETFYPGFEHDYHQYFGSHPSGLYHQGSHYKTEPYAYYYYPQYQQQHQSSQSQLPMKPLRIQVVDSNTGVRQPLTTLTLPLYPDLDPQMQQVTQQQSYRFKRMARDDDHDNDHDDDHSGEDHLDGDNKPPVVNCIVVVKEDDGKPEYEMSYEHHHAYPPHHHHNYPPPPHPYHYPYPHSHPHMHPTPPPPPPPPPSPPVRVYAGSRYRPVPYRSPHASSYSYSSPSYNYYESLGRAYMEYGHY